MSIGEINISTLENFDEIESKLSYIMSEAFRHSFLHWWRDTRVTLYTAGHLHTAVPHCWHSRAPIVHTAVPRENNEHGCVYLRCRAVCKLPGCVEGHPWDKWISLVPQVIVYHFLLCKMQTALRVVNQSYTVNSSFYLTQLPRVPHLSVGELWQR